MGVLVSCWAGFMHKTHTFMKDNVEVGIIVFAAGHIKQSLCMHDLLLHMDVTVSSGNLWHVLALVGNCHCQI